MEDKIKVGELDGFKAVMYMLFALEAKMNSQTKIIVELVEILTQKDPGTVEKEMAMNTVLELHKIRDRFVEDDELLTYISKIKF